VFAVALLSVVALPVVALPVVALPVVAFVYVRGDDVSRPEHRRVVP
jgi:hypothetical protein